MIACCLHSRGSGDGSGGSIELTLAIRRVETLDMTRGRGAVSSDDQGGVPADGLLGWDRSVL